MKRLALVTAIVLGVSLGTSPSRAQYDGSFTNVHQYAAWQAKSVYAKKRKSYSRHYSKRRYAKQRRSAVAYSGGASLSEIVARLQSQCGAKIISSVRPGARTPFGVQSCHATGQAVDMTGNYACMYSVLRSWPGGYTTDSGRCRHIHISSCRMEYGLRFKHSRC